MSDSLRHLLLMPARFDQFAETLTGMRAGAAAALALAAVVLTPAAHAAHHAAASKAHGAAHSHTVAAKSQARAKRTAADHASTATRHRGDQLHTAPAKGAAHTRGSAREQTVTTTSRSHAHEHYVPLSVASAETSHKRHASAGRQVERRVAVSTHVERPAAHTSSVALREDHKPATPPADDTSAQDRVHAWYAARATAAVEAADAAPKEAPVATAVKSTVLGSVTPVSTLPKNSVVATDTQTASQLPRITAVPPPASNVTRTSASDDAAYAEASHIPGTAPTERVPLPFVHGDFSAAETAHTAPAPKVVRVDPRADADVLASAAPGHAAKDGSAARPPLPVSISQPTFTAAAARKSRPDTTSEALDDDDVVASPQAGQGDAAGRKNAGYDLPLHGSPATNVTLYDSAGQLILLPPMKGSHEILVHQNQMAVADGLDRIANDSQMADMRRAKLLVALPDTDAIYPNGRLPLNRRFARPWTVRFLNDLGAAHWQRFHTPLIITSAARTVAFQRHLILVNGNAAPPTGDVASPHLYGQAIDIAKHSMGTAEIAWMRSYLTPVESAGKIDVEEEFQQACFHISVYRRYANLPEPNQLQQPAPQRRLELARTTQPAPATHPLQRVKAELKRRHRLPTALLATGLR